MNIDIMADIQNFVRLKPVAPLNEIINHINNTFAIDESAIKKAAELTSAKLYLYKDGQLHKTFYFPKNAPIAIVSNGDNAMVYCYGFAVKEIYIRGFKIQIDKE